jgi:Cyclic nucleotide-binding domain
MTCAEPDKVVGFEDTYRNAAFAGTWERAISLGYSIAATALKFRNKPALRLTAVILAAIFLVATLISSDHVNSLSLVSSLLFLAVNIFQMLLILWELRPVALQGDVRMLHDLVFSNLTASDFSKLTRFARWQDGEPGRLLAVQGSRVTEIIVLLAGHAQVERDGRQVAMLGAGAIIGEVGSLSAQPFSSTIRLARYSRYLVWNKDRLDHFFACHPSIASGFERAFISRLEAPAFRFS